MRKIILATLAIAGFAAPLLGGPLAAGAAPINGSELANGTAAPARKVAAADRRVGAAGLNLSGVVLPEARSR